MNKLNHVGIGGFSQKLLKSYITNKFQYVKIEGECSIMKLIKRGVPQGSTIGPLLFVIYINDLGVHDDWQSEITKYADDIAMIEKLNTQTEDKILFQS